ncbi:MAG: carbamoyl phosphate synthase, partial [Actinomycetota bacterium]|nr:carbamoyl phosphate synthase [Actinomycetota bacterium]
DRKWLKRLAPRPPEKPAAETEPSEGGEHATVEQSYTVEVSGRRFDVKVIGPAHGAGAEANGASRSVAARRPPRRTGRSGTGAAAGAGGDTLPSPIQGTVLKVAVARGSAIEEGALVAVVEAMKMENEITAHKSGTISELPIAVGASVATGDTIAVIASS